MAFRKMATHVFCVAVGSDADMLVTLFDDDDEQGDAEMPSQHAGDACFTLKTRPLDGVVAIFRTV